MKPHQVNIYDIAKVLKISKSTVSRALTGHPEVNPQTRKAVLELAAKLDYRRNMLSINLISRKTRLIGIIVPEFNTSFFPEVVVGAQEKARTYGYNIIISQSNENVNTEIENTQVMMANQVDGIIASVTKETPDFEHFKIFERKGIPIVFFNRVCEEMHVPKVVINDFDAAFTVTQHLIHTGKRRIAHLAGPETLATSRRRLAGYIHALRKNHIEIDENLIVPYDLTIGKVKSCVSYLMDMSSPPDGLFAINDPAAIEAIQTIKKMNIQIPKDIGIVGFSNDYGSDLIEPGLTTVAQPKKEMGSLAIELLFDLMNEDLVQGRAIIKTLNAELIIRNSSRIN